MTSSAGRQVISLIISRWLKAKGPKLLRAIAESESESGRKAVEIARDLSKGPWTSLHLRAMGHPYRHGGRPPSDPAVINRQSGYFLSAWVVRPSRKTENSYQTRIENFAPYAPFLFRGTRRMIRRPILERVRETLAPFRKKTFADAIRRIGR